jgi:hypothetical protein
MINDPYKFGHYRVGTVNMFSKVKALEVSAQINRPVSWHYDEVFESYDWTQEPKSDLGHLYKQRAQQIQDHYDYIVVFYSGGADSHNMLESFLHAGVHIDEIVSCHSFSADKDRNSRYNKEIFETAIPYVQSLRDQKRLSNDTQHRVIDMSEITMQVVQDINWLDFPYMANSAISINNIARTSLRKYIADWAKLIDQGRKLVLVWGHDKPRIMHDNGRFFLQFLDIFDNCVSPWTQQTCPAGWSDEIFYTTPDLPEIVIKQAHVIKNFLKTCSDSHPYIGEEVSGLGHVVKHQPDGSWKSLWLKQDAQSLLTYPWFDINLYYDKKPRDIIYSTRDIWFWSDNNISKKYHTVINGLVNQFGDTWLNYNSTTGIRATKNFKSKKYWLD